MKIIYIGTTASIIYTIRFQEPIKSTYDKGQDTFLHWKFAAAPCAGIALITQLIANGFFKLDILELLWTFSIYLESIAILPQLVVLQRYGEVENGCVSGVVYIELDLSCPYGSELQTSLGGLLLRCIANVAICRLLLLLLQKQVTGWEIYVTDGQKARFVNKKVQRTKKMKVILRKIQTSNLIIKLNFREEWCLLCFE